MPQPLTVSCFSKIQIGFTFLVPAHLGSSGKRAVKRVCVCVRVWMVTLLITWTEFWTNTQPVNSPLVRDYLGRPVPEETFIHSHPSWSPDILYQLTPSTTIHSILFIGLSFECTVYIKLSASGNASGFTHTHTHPFNGPFPWLPGWAGTRKVKPIWISLKQETVSGSGIS